MWVRKGGTDSVHIIERVRQGILWEALFNHSFVEWIVQGAPAVALEKQAARSVLEYIGVEHWKQSW